MLAVNGVKQQLLLWEDGGHLGGGVAGFTGSGAEVPVLLHQIHRAAHKQQRSIYTSKKLRIGEKEKKTQAKKWNFFF